jgi:trehalose 6-phosphate phosphatase
MKNVLSRRNTSVLEELAWSNVLLAFDFDGTLSPIVADRTRARMRASTRALLAEACALYPCAVISGRARADVTRLLDGVRVRFVVGNHGIEPSKGRAAFARATAAMRNALVAELGHVSGIDVEDKTLSLAIHYRKARNKREARTAIERAIASLSAPPRIVAGKQVVNVLPPGAPHKGIALAELRRAARVDTAIFVGDDVTDEDVFGMHAPGVLGIRVGMSTRSAADYFLPDQRHVDALVRRLIELRRRSGAREGDQ